MVNQAKARKANLAKRQQERYMAKIIKQYQKRAVDMNKRLKTALNELRLRLPKEDLKMLKALCMVDVPEQKNEQGEVVQAARQVLNKDALLREGVHALALQREHRIKTGKRKSTTGSSKQRASHRGTVAMIQVRNEEASKE